MVKKAERLVQSTPLSFSGHQTFPLRFPWLPKAVQRLLDYSDLFTSTDAMVILGVGKNMVDSIRHWSQVLGVVERDDAFCVNMDETPTLPEITVRRWRDAS